MKKLTPWLMVVAMLVLLVVAGVAWYYHIQSAHVRRAKQALLALAGNQAAVAQRVATIKQHLKDRIPADGRVGVAADGYVFLYDQHESHGADLIEDTNILYLPDEHRFIVSHEHFCAPPGKGLLKNKAEVVALYTE
ncbi:MAG: hypothetical protein ACYDBB_26195 [Armatimonadota bacterium]